MADARKNPKAPATTAPETVPAQTAQQVETNPLETPAETVKARKPRVKRDKAVSWKEKANIRVPRALKAIQSVAAIAKRSHYTYTEEEAKKLLSLFNKAMDSLDRAYLLAQPVPTEEQLF